MGKEEGVEKACKGLFRSKFLSRRFLRTNDGGVTSLKEDPS